MTGELTPLEKSLMGQVARLESELAALREKYRWRKQSEEPAPKDEKVEVATIGMFGGTCCISASGALLDIDSLKDCYWRPLDLPEDAHHA
ncbi:hypothetical protein SDC9_180582 [bioreactor metagenome]|uniref:Uncharacterized protein n=1 Tax=bioreactor metagenome TaxID=1076179 RepID=A0A645H4X9_9ZZZZ|nr:hypothetical protein [Cloacibacillus evryensis]MEA5034201.1 hypothetical protein [Cloacibacillus evryensis]